MALLLGLEKLLTMSLVGQDGVGLGSAWPQALGVAPQAGSGRAAGSPDEIAVGDMVGPEAPRARAQLQKQQTLASRRIRAFPCCARESRTSRPL